MGAGAALTIPPRHLQGRGFLISSPSRVVRRNEERCPILKYPHEDVLRRNEERRDLWLTELAGDAPYARTREVVACVTWPEARP